MRASVPSNGFDRDLGFAVLVGQYYAATIQRRLEEERIRTFVLGEVREGEPGVEFVS